MKFEKKIEVAKSMADSDLKLSTLTTLALQAVPHSRTQMDLQKELDRLYKAGYQIPIPEKYKPKTSASGEKYEVHIVGSESAPVIYDNKAQAEKTKKNAELLGFEMTIKKVESKQEANKMAEKKKNDKSPQKRNERFLTIRGSKVKVVDSLPDGWKEYKRATTAPKGYVWVTNNKSRFGGERKAALMKIPTQSGPVASAKAPKKTAAKPAAKTTTAQPKKVAQKPAVKRSEPKPAALKKEPTGVKKPASVKKSAADKLLVHNDKDEMKVDSKKPIVINGANVKPKPVPKVLRRVAKSGGYTAWDDIKRNGKTFATEQEAKDYAADVLKKTGKIVPISPTDRQVTHTFKPEEEKKKK